MLESGRRPDRILTMQPSLATRTMYGSNLVRSRFGIAVGFCVATSLFASGADAQALRLPRAIDFNPHPRIVETVLFVHEAEVQIADGKKTKMLAYNGSTPGPTIQAEVGDQLIVHVINLLPEPTVVHWHGVEMPAAMDGSHISQKTIPRFGYFRYAFKLNNAATYWYHSHYKTNEQVEKGLYGALIVRDRRNDIRLRVARHRENTLFLDDIRLDGENQIDRFSTDPTYNMVPWQRAEAQANSRPGTHLLVNGQEVTETKIPTLYVLAGAPYRLRFVNSSSGEVFRLGLSDANQRWYQIGSDQGVWNAAEKIQPIDQVIDPRGHHNLLISNNDRRLGVTLTPSDRAEVVIVPEGKRGDEYFIEQHDFIKGNHVAFRDPQNNLLFGHDHFDGADEPIRLVRVKIVGRVWWSRWRKWNPPSSLRWDPIRAIQPDPKLDTLPVIFGHAFPDKVTGDVTFFVQVKDPRPLIAKVRNKEMVMPPPFGPIPMMKQTAQDGYHVKVGERRIWEIVNFTGGDHSFHTHGFRFQHLDTQYIDLDEPTFNYTEKALRLSFEDTVRVPKRPNFVLGRSFTIMRVAVEFDDSSRPPSRRRTPKELLAGGLVPTATGSGGWLMHCHHLTHAARGMMSFITVTEK